MNDAGKLAAVRNGAYTLAGVVAVIGIYQLVDAYAYCGDGEPCSGPRAFPGLVLQIWTGYGLLVLAAVFALGGYLRHRKLRGRFPSLFPSGSIWIGARNTAGFLAIFALLAAAVQWEATGERWAPSQCDHDGTPIEDCPDYGYHGDQVRSLWMAAGYAALAVVASVVAVYGNLRVPRAPTGEPLPAARLRGRNDRVTLRLFWGAVASLALSVLCFLVARADRAGLAYAGVSLAALAAGSGLVLLVWPRSDILVKWAAVLLVAFGVMSGLMNFVVIVWSTMG